MYEHGMIAPVVALVIWSLIMLIWLYATRLPAMAKDKVDPKDMTRAYIEGLPSANVANNYNHLMEQPTIFYAIAFSLQLLGPVDHINIGLAWLYVALRVVHSFLQAAGQIMIRFLVFVISSLVLAAMTLHAAMQVFG
jgi:hypothetical protein